MKTRHLEEDQWLNRKELCLGQGRRRQLSQDRKDRQIFVYTKGVYQFACAELKAPGKTEGSQTLRNCVSSVWNLLHAVVKFYDCSCAFVKFVFPFFTLSLFSGNVSFVLPCELRCVVNVTKHKRVSYFNPLNPELNPICYLLTLLAHHFLHVSRIRVKSLTPRLLMSYIYMTLVA